jgi:phosphate transport system protein
MTYEIRHFAEELEELKTRLKLMGTIVQGRVGAAVRALVDADEHGLAAVIDGDPEVNALHVEIDDRCFKLLALQQPVAIDLRVIVGAAKINYDLERIGDMAVNIAEAGRRYVAHPPVKPLVDTPRMAALAQLMLSGALEAFIAQSAALARAVIDRDDELDALKNQIFRDLLQCMMADRKTIEPALDLILISRHLERIGDHATNIAEDVIFIVEARDVRHHAAD